MRVEKELEQAKTENAELRQKLAQDLERIALLEAQLAQNSRNSAKPPSSDGFKRPPKKESGKKTSDKKAGGQPGHSGQNLSWNEQPEHLIRHFPDKCQQCEFELGEVPSTGYQNRQVVELPTDLKLETTEHRAFIKSCPHCHTLTQATFPTEAKARLQYGSKVRALAVYLSQVQLLPYARTCETLQELFGASVSEGSLYQMLSECYEYLAEPEKVIKEGLVRSEVVHNDETGLYVEGLRQWLHVMCTSRLTFYAFHPKRGKAATDEIGLLPRFEGTSVHDGWSSYWTYSQCQHALCNAHHLRELTFVAEELGQLWAKAMIELLLALKAEVEEALVQNKQSLETTRLTYWAGRYRNLIAQGLATNPPPEGGWPKNKRGRPKQTKAKNLVDRLEARQREVLAFAYNFKVPFTNNQAERDLRMVKVQQKVSNCFRSKQGATFFCRIRGYISTLRKQGMSAFYALHQAFLGCPLIPLSTT
jgi:transposase